MSHTKCVFLIAELTENASCLFQPRTRTADSRDEGTNTRRCNHTRQRITLPCTPAGDRHCSRPPSGKPGSWPSRSRKPSSGSIALRFEDALRGICQRTTVSVPGKFFLHGASCPTAWSPFLPLSFLAQRPSTDRPKAQGDGSLRAGGREEEELFAAGLSRPCPGPPTPGLRSGGPAAPLGGPSCGCHPHLQVPHSRLLEGSGQPGSHGR